MVLKEKHHAKLLDLVKKSIESARYSGYDGRRFSPSAGAWTLGASKSGHPKLVSHTWYERYLLGVWMAEIGWI